MSVLMTLSDLDRPGRGSPVFPSDLHTYADTVWPMEVGGRVCKGPGTPPSRGRRWSPSAPHIWEYERVNWMWLLVSGMCSDVSHASSHGSRLQRFSFWSSPTCSYTFCRLWASPNIFGERKVLCLYVLFIILDRPGSEFSRGAVWAHPRFQSVSEMTYTVSSGALNCTIPYLDSSHTILTVLLFRTRACPSHSSRVCVTLRGVTVSVL